MAKSSGEGRTTPDNDRLSWHRFGEGLKKVLVNIERSLKKINKK